jgi:hypothetical protein
MFRCVVLLVALMVSTVAQAQVVPASGDPTYLAVTSTTGLGGGLCAPIKLVCSGVKLPP